VTGIKNVKNVFYIYAANRNAHPPTIAGVSGSL